MFILNGIITFTTLISQRHLPHNAKQVSTETQEPEGSRITITITNTDNNR
jgi:hypothetical protein